MKKICLAAIIACTLSCVTSLYAAQLSVPKAHTFGADSAVGRAFKNRASNVQVEGEGVVVRALADDFAGSRHQRFIVRLASGQTVLIAHNIDIAPRVAGLQKDDKIAFYGEYVWSEKGGIIHWTHHDPKGRHAAGWLKHNGQIYR